MGQNFQSSNRPIAVWLPVSHHTTRRLPSELKKKPCGLLGCLTRNRTSPLRTKIWCTTDIRLGKNFRYKKYLFSRQRLQKYCVFPMYQNFFWHFRYFFNFSQNERSCSFVVHFPFISRSNAVQKVPSWQYSPGTRALSVICCWVERFASSITWWTFISTD